jgi:hypothetical protein
MADASYGIEECREDLRRERQSHGLEVGKLQDDLAYERSLRAKPEHPLWIALYLSPFFLVGYTFGDLPTTPWGASAAASATCILAWIGLWHRVKRAEVDLTVAIILEGLFPVVLGVAGFLLSFLMR